MLLLGISTEMKVFENNNKKEQQKKSRDQKLQQWVSLFNLQQQKLQG